MKMHNVIYYQWMNAIDSCVHLDNMISIV